VEGDRYMPLLIVIAAGILLFVIESRGTKPGDPL
jgi:hypothetical protein